jgi:DNA-directed RNA polymerase subunit M/transcription elongation factor TFIIS
MEGNKYNREITFFCPECGSATWEFDGEKEEIPGIVKCASCGREYSREQLIQCNKQNIDKNFSEMAEEAIKDGVEELKESLKKSFRGNKNIKWR